jgi:periplasmic protein TonB
MYASGLKTRDRGGAIVAVALIHAGLLFALMNLSGPLGRAAVPGDTLQVVEIAPLEVPPPEPPRPVEREREAAAEPEGAAAPENIRSRPTPVVAPPPPIPIPRPSPVVVAEAPGEGAAPTQGASDRPGPGTGAGGTGTGTGAGGSGSGTGGGGSGIARRAGIAQDITDRDYPPAVLRRWPRGGRVFVRLRIEADGRPSQCDVMRGFGDPVAEQWTCSLLLSRGRFRPAVDERGRPVADWYGYIREEEDR